MRVVEAENDFPDLFDLMNRIFFLSHGQASIERGFSANKDLIAENRNPESLIARCHVYDFARDVGLSMLDISPQLLNAARSALCDFENAKEEMEKRQTEEEKKQEAGKWASVETKAKEEEEKR